MEATGNYQFLVEIITFFVSMGVSGFVVNRMKERFKITGHAAVVAVACVGGLLLALGSVVLPEAIKVQIIAFFQAGLLFARIVYDLLKGNVTTKADYEEKKQQ